MAKLLERATRDRSWTTQRGTMPASTIMDFSRPAAPPSMAWPSPSAALPLADRYVPSYQRAPSDTTT